MIVHWILPSIAILVVGFDIILNLVIRKHLKANLKHLETMIELLQEIRK